MLYKPQLVESGNVELWVRRTDCKVILGFWTAGGVGIRVPISCIVQGSAVFVLPYIDLVRFAACVLSSHPWVVISMSALFSKRLQCCLYLTCVPPAATQSLIGGLIHSSYGLDVYI